MCDLFIASFLHPPWWWSVLPTIPAPETLPSMMYTLMPMWQPWTCNTWVSLPESFPAQPLCSWTFPIHELSMLGLAITAPTQESSKAYSSLHCVDYNFGRSAPWFEAPLVYFCSFSFQDSHLHHGLKAFPTQFCFLPFPLSQASLPNPPQTTWKSVPSQHLLLRGLKLHNVFVTGLNSQHNINLHCCKVRLYLAKSRDWILSKVD